MNFFIRLIISSTLLLAVSQLSLAVQAGGQITPRPSGIDTTGIVERGGTINVVNLTEKTMVVDGVSYAFSAMPVKIRDSLGKTQDKSFVLKAGMQIRFSTSKENWSARDQVREIWVTSIGGKPSRQ